MSCDLSLADHISVLTGSSRRIGFYCRGIGEGPGLYTITVRLPNVSLELSFLGLASFLKQTLHGLLGSHCCGGSREVVEKTDWNGNGRWADFHSLACFQDGALLHQCLTSLELDTLQFTLLKNVSLLSSTIAGERSSPHCVGRGTVSRSETTLFYDFRLIFQVSASNTLKSPCLIPKT